MSEDRVLALQGVHNFRDYGGYAVSGGGRLKRGALWRSGQHHGATDADLEKIAALGLGSVFDLRSGVERTNHPCRRSAGFSAVVHFGEESTARTAPHLAAAPRRQQRSAADVHESMLRNYRGICFRPELQAMMRRYIAGLLDGTGSSLINCMAGKDRTGVAVALLHLAVGVHRDDVMEDYLLTNTAGDTEARIAAGAETIRAMSGDLDSEVVRVLMGVEPEYLEAAFDAIEERHGSMASYLEDGLGMDEAARMRLREVLAEG